jgi:hypothetical protein
MRFPSAREMAEKLLCDKCLTLVEGEGLYTVKIEEYCPKCRIKMGAPFSELFRQMADVEESQ